MDLKIFFTAFTTIFLAELFDKTELAVFSLSAKGHNKVTVFLGAMAAFFVATMLAVLFGDTLSKFIDPKIMRYVSAGVFFVAGFLILAGKL
ncbi:MAG: TMEM165/GDT1 family protein [Candidatus Omnitrophica bacterium]|nr:TMEM165/GDT1 family protein [Candidatus Omnitrophota bacterium]